MLKTIKISYLKTVYGELIIGDFDGKLCLCDWRYRKMRSSIDDRIKKGLDAEYVEGNSVIIDITKDQLNQYFNRERRDFDLPVLLVGTEFQKNVWNTLMQIPYGETNTYLGLSKKLGNEKAIRAVATANGANAISIIVPCHRIIGTNGKMVGYAGGLSAKSKLLKLENAIQKSQLDLFDQ